MTPIRYLFDKLKEGGSHERFYFKPDAIFLSPDAYSSATVEGKGQRRSRRSLDQAGCSKTAISAASLRAGRGA